MEAWTWGLVLKPLIAVLLFVGLFGGAKLIAKLIYWLLPDGKLKRELFKTGVNDPDPKQRPILPGQKSDR